MFGLLTTAERTYRRLAKQANQRAVRLERYLAKHENAPKGGLELYQYYKSWAFGDERKRFPENPKGLSGEQLEQYTVMLQNFLNSDLSQASKVKKYEKQYNEYLKKRYAELKGGKKSETDNVPPTVDEWLDNKANGYFQSAKRVSQTVLGGQKILSPQEFFSQVKDFYKNKLTDIVGYRTAMQIVLSVQNKSPELVRNEIYKIADELANLKEITYRQMKERFENLPDKKR